MTKQHLIMSNESGEDTKAEDQKGDEAKGEDTGDDTAKGQGDEKAKADETPEAKHARLKRQLEQHEKKHGLGKKDEKADAQATDKSKTADFDYGQKAFLIANGIKGPEETKLVKDLIAETGKSLEDLLESTYFQAQIKEHREAVASSEAIPKGTKRSGQAARDSVEYWIAKGENPPNTPENQKLRRDIVNAKLKAKSTGSKFTSTPVA